MMRLRTRVLARWCCLVAVVLMASSCSDPLDTGVAIWPPAMEPGSSPSQRPFRATIYNQASEPIICRCFVYEGRDVSVWSPETLTVGASASRRVLQGQAVDCLCGLERLEGSFVREWTWAVDE